MNAVCLTGNRPQKIPFAEGSRQHAELMERMRAAVVQLIEEGYTRFITGMALGADTWFAECVLDLKDGEHRKNFENTMARLLELGALPVINENDSVATEELEIDNDTMGALVAEAVGAELLILLSDIDGLYTADPHKDPSARLIHDVCALTPEITALGGGEGSALGTGGMAAKLKAAEIAVGAGIDMVIANGAHPSVLYDIIEGKPVGTRFYGHTPGQKEERE